MPEQENSNDVVNVKELMEIMDDDMELIHDCFIDFTQEWPGLLLEIKNAVLEKEAQKLDAAAHKLKGTLRYLAAEAAADAAYALESAGKDNDMDDVENKLLSLENECRKVIVFIDNFIQ